MGYQKLVRVNRDVINADRYKSYWNNYQFSTKVTMGGGGVGGNYFWNTAYFSKLLIIAKDVAAVDSRYISNMLQYVKQYQSAGSFNDRVHISYYCPQSDATRVPITAFIISALLEDNYYSHSAHINAGIDYLEAQVPLMVSYFDMSIASYAISLHTKITQAKKTVLADLLVKLISEAEKPGKHMFWHISRTQKYTSNSAVQVETASYVILAMIKSDSKKYMEHILSIMNWLLSIKNSDGGYRHSHDTGKEHFIF